MMLRKYIIHKSRYSRFLIISCSMMAFLLLLGSNVRSQQVIPLVIIGNQKGAPSTMKMTELLSVMRGEKEQWKGKVKIKVAIMKTTTPVGKRTAEEIYKMSGDELLKFFSLLSYGGTVHAAKTFYNITDLQNFIAENPGAIGVVDKMLPNDDIKIITINGN